MSRFTKFATIATLGLAIGVMAPSDANAKGKAKKKTKVRVTKKVATKVVKKELPPAKNYDFLADDIDGDRIRPDDTTIFGIQNVKHTSLIKLREHFINEIVRSAEML